MTCTGFDAVMQDVCLKIEHASSKYEKTFDECLARIKEFHDSWEKS